MAPQKKREPPFAKDEIVLCFHHQLLYEAKIIDVRESEEAGGWELKIHYKGWKSSWDDWVPLERVRKNNAENQALASEMMEQHQVARKSKAAKDKSAKKRAANGSELGSARGSEDRGPAVTQSGRSRGGRRDYDLEAEEIFNSRPQIEMKFPDDVKAYLVDDWENVTKNHMLYSLPSEVTVSGLLKKYLDEEREKRDNDGFAVVEEVVAGLRDYFDKCLGRILLYRFERTQYLEITEAWATEGSEVYEKTPSDTYGAPHLLRLMVTLPELVAQTNMDKSSVNRLRDELLKFSHWISADERATLFDDKKMESPGESYVERAR